METLTVPPILHSIWIDVITTGLEDTDIQQQVLQHKKGLKSYISSKGHNHITASISQIVLSQSSLVIFQTFNLSWHSSQNGPYRTQYGLILYIVIIALTATGLTIPDNFTRWCLMTTKTGKSLQMISKSGQKYLRSYKIQRNKVFPSVSKCI